MKIKMIIPTAAVAALVLSACGSSAEIDINALSADLMSSDIFSEKLDEVSSSVIEKRLSIDEDQVAEIFGAAGTKAVVDEFAIIKLADGASAADVEKGIENHIEKQKDSYASYKPEEVPKLEDYVLVSSGNYEILVVSDDSSKAKEIINKYTK